MLLEFGGESPNQEKKKGGIYEKLGSNEIILNNDNDEKRMLFENCRLKSKRVVNPIVDWTDDDVWDFLKSDAAPPVNPLYGEGWCRVGCVGCPLAKKKVRQAEFARWPGYKQLYINAFDRMMEVRAATKKNQWIDWNGMDVFNWWMEYDVLPGQDDLFEMEDYEWMDY